MEKEERKVMRDLQANKAFSWWGAGDFAPASLC